MLKGNSRTSLLCSRNLHMYFYWSVMYQKENPDENLQKMEKKITKKYLLLRKIFFPKKMLNSFTQNSPLNVETHFPQSAALFFLQLNHCDGPYFIL